MAIIDHVTLTVSDYARSKVLYEEARAPLVIQTLEDFGQVSGFGH
jgi:catechol 2,3-dioxygenase-like lactoylglutathione lyase family enzyme